MILLDTHVWIWVASDPNRLSRRAAFTKDDRIRSSPLLKTIW